MPCYATEVSIREKERERERERERKREEEAVRKKAEIKKKKKAIIAALAASGYKVEMGASQGNKILIIGKRG